MAKPTGQRGPIGQQFPPSTAPFLDQGGCLTPVWYRYFLNSFQREGGPQDDIYLLLFGLLGQSVQQQANAREFDSVSDTLATLQSLVLSRPSADTLLAGLRDEISELRAQLLSRKAYDGAIEALSVSVDALKLQATDIDQRQQIAIASIGDAVNSAQRLNISQIQTSAVQNKYIIDSITAVDNQFATLTTTNVTEGSNLYFTSARARNAISVTGSLSYNVTTGVISYTTPSNSGTASAWQTARTLSFTGNVSGSLTGVDGSANVSGTLTIGAGQVTTSMLAFTLATVATSGSYTDLINRPIGAYTATIITPTGYMNVTDAGGTVRRVLVG